MYKLTLSKDERSAIDWIGNRYNHGNDFYSLLIQCDYDGYNTSEAWTNAEELTFFIPEHIAWEINDLLSDRDYALDCFSGDFAAKLINFCLEIV